MDTTVQVVERSVPAGECYLAPGPELYSLDVVTEGHVILEQDGRRAVLGPGDCTLIDSSQPVRCMHGPARHIMVTFPGALLAPEASRLVAVRFPGDENPGSLIAGLVRELPSRMDARLGVAVVGLLSAAITSDRPGEPCLLQRVHAYIEAHLGDPGLSPSTIARAHHISLRGLYKLFDDQLVGVAGWIRQRRLERCRQDLVHPAAMPIRAIAARWGFTDPSHFNRLFRKEYGITPGEYRRLAV